MSIGFAKKFIGIYLAILGIVLIWSVAGSQ